MVSGPALPERPAMVPGGAQCFVSGDCGRAVFFPRSTILADQDDRDCVALEDRCMAAAGVVGAVSGHRADLFAFGDLVQQLRRNGAVTFAAGGTVTCRQLGRAVDIRWTLHRGLLFGQSEPSPEA